MGLSESVKGAINRHAPALVPPLKAMRGTAQAVRSALSRLVGRLAVAGRLRARFFDRRRRPIFEGIYRDNSWRGIESRSGIGSELEATALLRSQLPLVLERYRVRSMLDIPCGDFFWIQHVPLDLDYIGADIVPAIIAGNTQRHAHARRRFLVLDMVRDPLPAAELILCRDGLVHLSFEEAALALRNFKRSGATYLMATTFFDWPRNRNATTGSWRPLNMRLPPFNFPEATDLVIERGPEELYPDKSLGLWRLSHVPG